MHRCMMLKSSFIAVASLMLAVTSTSLAYESFSREFAVGNTGRSQLQMINVDQMSTDCLPDDDMLTQQMFECFELMDVDVKSGHLHITFANQASREGMFCKIYNFTGIVEELHSAKVTTYIYDEEAVDHYYNTHPEVYQRLFQEEVEDAIEQEVAKEVDQELGAALNDPQNLDKDKLKKKMFEIADAIAEAAEELMEENSNRQAEGKQLPGRPVGMTGAHKDPSHMEGAGGNDDAQSNVDVHDSVMYAKDGLIFWKFDDTCTYTYKVVANPFLLDVSATAQAGPEASRAEFVPKAPPIDRLAEMKAEFL